MGLDEYDYALVDDAASIAEAAQLLCKARSKDAVTKALKVRQIVCRPHSICL